MRKKITFILLLSFAFLQINAQDTAPSSMSSFGCSEEGLTITSGGGSYAVDINEPRVISINGPQRPEVGEEVFYEAVLDFSVPGVTYNWTVPSSATIIYNLGSRILVKFAQYGVFWIQCSAGTTTLEYAKKVEVMRPIPPQYSISSESNSDMVTINKTVQQASEQPVLISVH